MNLLLPAVGAVVAVAAGVVLARLVRTERSAPSPLLVVVSALGAWAVLARLPTASAVAIGSLSIVWVALVLIDVATSTLPRELTVALLVATPVALTVAGLVDDRWRWGPTLGGTAVWFGVIGVLWWASRGRAMGFGDVLLAPSLGYATGSIGWGAVAVGLFAAFALGAVVGVAITAVNGRGLRSRIPFGPFLVAGAAVGLAIGPAAADLYLRGAGLAG